MTWPEWLDAGRPLPYLDPGLSCYVDVNGVRLADSGADLDAGAPTVLTGAKITWGRSTIVDQPDAATASFQIGTRSADSGFLADRRLDVGSTVQLYGSGAITSGLDVNTIADPGFESLPLGPVSPSRVQASRAQQVQAVPSPTAGGARSVGSSVLGFPGGQARDLGIPPAPFTPDRTAWDHLPSMHYPADYYVTVTVHAPAGARFQIGAIAYRDPIPSGYQFLAPLADGIGTGAWQTFTALPGRVPPGLDDYWAGVRFSWTPQAWRDLPNSWAETPGSWADYGTAYVDDVAIQYAAKQAPRDVLIFTGRVTDIEARMTGSPLMLTVDVTAADPIAELGNLMVGDQPWTVESLGARAARIMALTGTGIPVQVDAPAAGRQVTYRDVDRQAAAGLIQELAASAGAVAWMATHATAAGPYWLIEDPSSRRAGLYMLEMVDGIVQIVVASAAGPFVELSAARVLLDPARFRKSVADVTTVVDLTWLTQGVDDQGKPTTTETHSTVTADPAALALYGYRRYGLSTQLSQQVDGDAVAQLIYARLAVPNWRIGGLSWDTRVGPNWTDADTTLALDLLDGQRRLGHPLMIVDVPTWTPDGADRVPVYVEGGTYTFDNAVWRMDFNVSGAAGVGVSVAWADLDPTWAWNEFDPSIAWADLVGVSGPGASS